MTNFEKSCEEFKKKNGYLTQKQLATLAKIRKERKTRRMNHFAFKGMTKEDDSLFASAFDWGSQ